MLSSSEVARLRAAPLTYAEVGATLSGALPSGYGVLRRSRRVGTGPESLRAAADRVLGWQVQRRAGVRVLASADRVVDGAVASLRLGVGPLGVDAPVRVVGLVDEPHRQGFAYGTLPGHPEQGEESFVVELADDGTVTFAVTAFSRPATRLARLGGPATRAVQSWMTGRYLAAVART